MTLDSEEIELLTKVCPSYIGCCDGPEWRGHTCSYHEGWLDGYAVADDVG